MSDKDNFSAPPQKTLERLAERQIEIAELERELNLRYDDIAALQDKLSFAKNLRDETKRTIEEYEEMSAAQARRLEVEVGTLRPEGYVREVRTSVQPRDQRGPLAVPMPRVGERVLNALWRAGRPIAAREIVETLGLSRAAVGVSLANLHKANKRYADKDPATGLWTITPKGIEVAETTP